MFDKITSSSVTVWKEKVVKFTKLTQERSIRKVDQKNDCEANEVHKNIHLTSRYKSITSSIHLIHLFHLMLGDYAQFYIQLWMHSSIQKLPDVISHVCSC